MAGATCESATRYLLKNTQNSFKANQVRYQVNEDGERLLYGVGRCVKMATSLASEVKDDDKTDEELAEFTIH